MGYDDDGSGGGRASTALVCDVETIRGSASDGWAITTGRSANPPASPAEIEADD